MVGLAEKLRLCRADDACMGHGPRSSAPDRSCGTKPSKSKTWAMETRQRTSWKRIPGMGEKQAKANEIRTITYTPEQRRGVRMGHAYTRHKSARLGAPKAPFALPVGNSASFAFPSCRSATQLTLHPLRLQGKGVIPFSIPGFQVMLRDFPGLFPGFSSHVRGPGTALWPGPTRVFGSLSKRG